MKTSLLGLLLLALIAPSFGLIHQIRFADDARSSVRLETFGFFTGGSMTLKMRDFSMLSNADNTPRTLGQESAGFYLKYSEVDSGVASFESEMQNAKQCIMDANFVAITETTLEKTFEITGMNERKEGFYSIYFFNCEEGTRVSFVLELINVNPGPNYLSAGLTPLPTMYALLFVVYIGVLFIWLIYFMRGQGKKVYRIHHLMSVLILLKIMSLLFEAVEFHYKKTTGHPGGWAIAYYVFAGLKGITVFVVIALIGTGWAFIKPFLSDKDKKIFLVVIPLQILSNIAMVILEETAPGSQAGSLGKKYSGWSISFAAEPSSCPSSGPSSICVTLPKVTAKPNGTWKS